MRFKLPVDVDVQVVAHLGLIVRGVVRRVTLHYLGRMDLQLEEMFLQLEYFHSMFSQLV